MLKRISWKDLKKKTLENLPRNIMSWMKTIILLILIAIPLANLEAFQNTKVEVNLFILWFLMVFAFNEGFGNVVKFFKAVRKIGEVEM